MEQDIKKDTVTVTAPEEEVVQLPPNPEMLTSRMEELRQEIGQITNLINANQKQLDTYVAAFNWYSQQLEAAEWENLNPSMEKQ
tara:strand:+ start:1397 stop:1648 length:252 start_codon:yes stop_codon:yes gene_type:complete